MWAACGSAATITVNDADDNTVSGNGACSLREALNNLNAGSDTTTGDCSAGTASGDTVVFTLGLPATIVLSLGQLDIEKDVIISGPGVDSLSIKGAGTRIFKIVASTVTMSDLAIERGRAKEVNDNNGGGIAASGDSAVTLTNCVFRGNSAANGGAISTDGSLTLTNCTFSRNKASVEGGAIFLDDSGGVFNATFATFSRNKAGEGGGAINARLVAGGIATCQNCMFERNKAARGGAISGSVSLADSILSRNSAREVGGGMEATSEYGPLTVSNCSFINNKIGRGGIGGGVRLIAQDFPISIASSTFNGNKVGSDGYGGGVYIADFNNGAAVTLTNCTVTANKLGKAGVGGGALFAAVGNAFSLKILNCTFGKNKIGSGSFGAGVSFVTSAPAEVLVRNTMVVNNAGGDDCVFGGFSSPALVSGGHNLDSDGTCFVAGGTDLLAVDPLFAPLGAYGGPTDTLALCSAVEVPDLSCTGASPAIDAGDDAVTGPPDNLTVDQRGLPRHAGSHVDIGAYESQ